MLLKKKGGVFVMKLQDTRTFSVVLITAITLVFASCAAPPPPTTTEDMQVIKNLQGTWTSNSEKVGLTLKISGQEVTSYHLSTSPTMDKIDPLRVNQLAQERDDNHYTVTYDVIDGKMVFRSRATNHKLVFWLTGPNTMNGYRDDLPKNPWKMHRVLEK
jgi:hypothetical protein